MLEIDIKLLPFQGVTNERALTQGVASLALGYVHHWAFSPSLLNPKLQYGKTFLFVMIKLGRGYVESNIKNRTNKPLSPFRPSLIVLLFHFIVRIVAQHLHGISLNPYFAPKKRLTTDVDIAPSHHEK